MKNSIMIYDTETVDNYIVQDYFSYDYDKVYDYVNTCTEDMFDYIYMRDDIKMEALSLELYDSSNYWDILLIINGINPLFDLPYRYDTLVENSEIFVSEYEKKFNITLTEQQKQIMIDKNFSQRYENNEKLRLLKIVKKSRLNEFIRLGYQKGCFV